MFLITLIQIPFTEFLRSLLHTILTSHTILSIAYHYCCHNNDLVVDHNKTNKVSFGHHKSELPIIPGVTMEDQVKFIGLTLDNVNPDSIHNWSKRLKSSVYVIKQFRAISDIATAKNSYFALFLYASKVWSCCLGPASEANRKKSPQENLIMTPKIWQLHRYISITEYFNNCGPSYERHSDACGRRNPIKRIKSTQYCTSNADLSNAPTHHLQEIKEQKVEVIYLLIIWINY